MYPAILVGPRPHGTPLELDLGKPLSVLNASAGTWWYPKLGDEFVAVSTDPDDGPTLLRGHITRFKTARHVQPGVPWNGTVAEIATGDSDPMVTVATAFGDERGGRSRWISTRHWCCFTVVDTSIGAHKGGGEGKGREGELV